MALPFSVYHDVDDIDLCPRCGGLIWRIPNIPLDAVRNIAERCGLRIIFKRQVRGDVCYADKGNSKQRGQLPPIIITNTASTQQPTVLGNPLRPPIAGSTAPQPQRSAEADRATPTGEVE